MKVQEKINKTILEKGAAYLILIDPDEISGDKLINFVRHCEKSGVDGFLVGGSLMMSNILDEVLETISNVSSLPTILFPGSVSQVSSKANAILFISLISGRNAEHLIGTHVIAAPIIKRNGLEAISTGYMLIESGKKTTAEYMSGSSPIPRNKPEIATATALAAEYLGMKYVYLEGGSGAKKTVPNEMIKMVSSAISIPIIVGGGIKDSKTAREKVENGASVIITGNFFEDETNWHLVKEFADAIHINLPVEV
ncbi:MAG: geranylgeranylglyceryl/heptaprenylglyceryl phosphate synthase [Bacteroidetes bacterium]|nr:geranylgeranylglyceryl/heptaprenylglyceryl phosphate synthase [Bacteroidota bacterium]MBU1116854.1 geranylgeranylglyceryl/heptaprenylglyceryl phosphate synthase [Bacteroidota bacterium]MBU1798037.1 geranylgeranylglyceryl/heptaprenylglyceryl phosphate synthase [Bacteroidota bacterium]